MAWKHATLTLNILKGVSLPMSKYLLRILVAGLMVMCLLIPTVAAQTGGKDITILFTHDMHSHQLPANDEGKSYGGYARLQTAINAQREKHPDAILVDAGDFAMGSLFQTIYATDASELRIMGAMGYDVTTLGNHEFDYRAQGLADMLNAAVDSGDILPQIVQANYKPPVEGSEGYHADTQAVWEALDRYGVKDYTVIERGGVNFAIFGMMGYDADECAPMSGMVMEDTVTAAQRTVEAINAAVPEPRVVVCLSHGGIWDNPKESEDELLAQKVPGIDVIISGHTHSTLEEPIVVNNTYIVSAGEYSKNLGVLNLKLTDTGIVFDDYELIPINDQLEDDPAIAAKIESFKPLVEKNYLSKFGDLSYDTVLATNPYVFESLAELAEHKESTLGNLIADAYRWSVQQVEGEDYVPVDFALTANGVVRESLPTGKLTVSDVFNVSSLGIGADGVPGYPLVSVWLTGRDLKNAFEVDASITSLMSAAQLYFSGMTFTYNPNRLIFNKVTDCHQVNADGSLSEIVDDQLYRVVTGLYCGQMLGAVNAQSFGILTITPRDAQGNPIENLEEFIVHDQNGNELKEWYALAAYLQDMGTISEKYATTDGRKIMNDSLNPVELLRNPNGITMAVLSVVLLLILLVVGMVYRVVRKHNKKNT